MATTMAVRRKTTPIARNYEFDVCLPPAHPGGTLAWTSSQAPETPSAVDPMITERTPAGPACQGSFDPQKMLHASSLSAGSGAVPEDVYARKIYAGWVGGTQPELRHFKVTLKRMDLHDDQDLISVTASKLSFFWMNVNRAAIPNAIRLSDFANGNMNDYHDDEFGRRVDEFYRGGVRLLRPCGPAVHHQRQRRPPDRSRTGSSGNHDLQAVHQRGLVARWTAGCGEQRTSMVQVAEPR